MLEDSANLDFNFWPSFADSMLAVVFILVVILAIVAQQRGIGPNVRKSQRLVLQSIAEQYNVTPDSLPQSLTESEYVIGGEGDPKITIRHNGQLQRITFGGNVLFPQNDYHLTKRGRSVLRIVGEAILPQLERISQVQIEGHTDTVRTKQYIEGNLELGARRSMSVFRFLSEEVGINPARHLISATSYGKYKPVGRSAGDSYDKGKLREANDTREKRRRNRRIELLMIYGDSEDPVAASSKFGNKE